MLKTKRLQDILPQIPFSKIKKVSDTPFIYFQLGEKLVVGNGHIFFLLGSEYLKPVEEYELQLKTQIHGQLVITEANIANLGSVDNLLNFCGYKDSAIFSKDHYGQSYLNIVQQFTKCKPAMTLKKDTNIWTSQVSLWETEDISLLLVGILKHK